MAPKKKVKKVKTLPTKTLSVNKAKGVKGGGKKIFGKIEWP
jgi:hypothetical protein